MENENRKPSDRILWCDCETGGFPLESPLLEIAFVVTDSELNIIEDNAIFSSIICDISPQALQDVWEQHHATGLTEEITSVSQRWEVGKDTLTSRDVEGKAVDFLNAYGIYEGMPEKPPLAGSSVWFDRLRINRYMPKIASLISHRNIDVSTIRELQLRWDRENHPPRSEAVHRALRDIMESLNQLKFFRNNGFIGGKK